MRVITAETMKELDTRTIRDYGISGLQLMECAGRCCADEIVAEFAVPGRAVVLVGKGNNGGDGSVIARLLLEKGWSITVIVLSERDQITGDAAIQLEKLPEEIIQYSVRKGHLASRYMDVISDADIVVDALFGTGLRGLVSGMYLEAINLINASGRPVFAVDIPSGIHGSTGRVLGNAVKAHTTITFALAKLGHILYPGSEHTGRLVIADIGIPPNLMESTAGYDFLDSEMVRPLIRCRDRQAHKGHFGHCLIIAGSTGKSGAAALSANSAVRSGSGLVTVAAPESIHTILEIKTTEAMTVPLPDSGAGHITDDAFASIELLLPGKSAVAIGPGLGHHGGTGALLKKLLETITVPVVIDADGLNALAEDVTVLQLKKSKQIVLTPHPGEMSRLLGTALPTAESISISAVQDFARTHGVFVVLKGARSIIASPYGTTAINGSGNPGMASGGMGDVLTGIIASLLGQGYTAWDACRLGVFLHGFAADMVAQKKGEIGLTATDVLEQVPYAYNALLKRENSNADRS